MYKLLKNIKILRHLQNKQCWVGFSESIDFLYKNHKDISPKEIKSLYKHIKFGKELNTKYIETVYKKLCRELQNLDEKELKNRNKLVRSFASLIELENKSHEINSMHFFDFYYEINDKHRVNIKKSLLNIILDARRNKKQSIKKQEDLFNITLLFLEKEVSISISEISSLLLNLENLQWKNKENKILDADIKVIKLFFKRIKNTLLEDKTIFN
ncbi:hypothetical protein [Vibrio splendidus]|uniref:hypothetical protein n=1 Tax=Vibrio splendidus TaxID=29497 RepID=UPI00076AAA58|nr:hypothetical protein [Vibrio splendidus]PHX06533.1 hypothetical protein VSPL_18230 [Vibrio splendidus]